MAEAGVAEPIGDIIHCRSFIREMNLSAGHGGVLALGISNDRIALRQGRYWFVQRHWNLVYRGPMDFPGRLWPHPAFDASPYDPDIERPSRLTRAEMMAGRPL